MNGITVRFEAFHWEIKFGFIIFRCNTFLSFDNGIKLRNDTVFVIVQTNTQVNLFSARISIKLFH
ncbi:hypothetical protein AXY46_26625 [Achromobacter xylosoxidans]|nr:hypothetical protein AXY46_26625 [Achromobacter xylosoxidans]